ncbi:hypothetical protein C9446_10390 [Providencia heimbachae]|uniref:energy transducer TonB n=1 Tax=Providencia heimbachae TaxID=333962 RepID=UPI0010BEC4FE|nr:energy transducer TonB [Providencia heimbachae]QCJ70227.1 hypothetical protein C9446_10390 [Providencia heimbachae]
MTHLRFVYAVIGSLLLHAGLLYYSHQISSVSAKITVPINSTVMTVSMDQFLLEKHIAKVEEVTVDTGGVINSSVEVEKAVIEVAKERSEIASEDRSPKTKANLEKPRKTPEIQPIKRVKSTIIAKKLNIDDTEQQFKAGENQTQLQATGLQGEQQTVMVGENINDIRLSYLAKVRNELDRHKKYPRRARTMHMEGSVIVHFQITPQGELINVSVVESEHSKIFGNAVLDAAKRYKSVGVKPENVNALNSIRIQFSLDK